MMYVIKTQGYEYGAQFTSRASAVAQVLRFVRADVIDCRHKFGTAVTQRWDNDMWEVRPLKDRQGPLWSRYTIHVIG